MKSTKILFNLFATILILSSCKVSYIVTYQTYLEGNPEESNEFIDSIMKINFDPRPHGIDFDIENLITNNLYLIWDKSYFIEPSGESSKALNQDVLVTASSIRDKENYESVIPQRAHFKRFTCSSTNISFLNTIESFSHYSELLKSINTYTITNKSWSSSVYWYIGEDISYSSKSEIPMLNNRVVNKALKEINEKNNLAIGFTIKDKDKEIEYHFKFPIKKVEIYNRTSSDAKYTKIFELNKDNNFKVISLGQRGSLINGPQKPQQRIESDGLIITCVECGKEFKLTGLTKGKVNCPYCNAVNIIGQP